MELYLPKEIQALPPAPLALAQGPQGYGYGMQPGYKAGIFSPPSPKSLVKGNSVRVTQGDLSGLTGKILQINDDGTVILNPSAELASALNMSTNTELVVQKSDIEIIANSRVSPVSPAYQPTSPVSPRTPESPAYHPRTPESPPYRPRTPVEPNSPPYRPRTPKTPEFKGGAKTRAKRGSAKRTTRKTKKGVIDNYKTVFTNMWKIYADRKYKGK